MSDLWAFCLSFCSLLSGLVLDVVACPGRCFAPLIWALELDVSAINAVVAGGYTQAQARHPVPQSPTPFPSAGHLVPNTLVCCLLLLLMASSSSISVAQLRDVGNYPPLIILCVSVFWILLSLLLLVDAAASLSVVVAGMATGNVTYGVWRVTCDVRSVTCGT
jgi:hypothetical protein